MNWHIVLASFPILGLASSGHSSHEAAVGSSDIQRLPSFARTTSLSDALRLLPVSVDDIVRVGSTPLSISLGIAGLVGQVTEVPRQQAKGNESAPKSQFAESFTVFVAELDREISVPDSMIELIGLAPGATVLVDGRKWVSADDGEWKEVCYDGGGRFPHFIYP